MWLVEIMCTVYGNIATKIHHHRKWLLFNTTVPLNAVQIDIPSAKWLNAPPAVIVRPAPSPPIESPAGKKRKLADAPPSLGFGVGLNFYLT
jgi:hypothetical protein